MIGLTHGRAVARLLGVILLLPCVACGGKSSALEATSGGSAHGGSGNVAGGASGGGGASAGTGGLSAECPETAPTPGAPCNYPSSELCNYPLDPCNSASFQCAGGVWVPASVTQGAAETCFNFRPDQQGIPNDGDSCACRGLLDCTFDECSAQGEVHARCDNSVWHVTSEPCRDRPCGPDGLRCKLGEACVLPGGLGASYTCQPDPCAEMSETTSCTCAASLCGGAGNDCTLANGVIECSCPAC